MKSVLDQVYTIHKNHLSLLTVVPSGVRGLTIPGEAPEGSLLQVYSHKICNLELPFPTHLAFRNHERQESLAKWGIRKNILYGPDPP